MKITIDSLYNDHNNLFADNAMLNADERLSNIASLSDDLDLIVEMTYGSREFFKRFIKEDTNEVYIYDLSKIHKSVYATLVENNLKYQAMIFADEKFVDSDPLEQFYEKKIIGERVREKWRIRRNYVILWAKSYQHFQHPLWKNGRNRGIVADY